MTMPQGGSGLDAGAWGAEWTAVNITRNAQGAVTATSPAVGVFENRTRSVVEAHYKGSLSATDPWIKARDALFETLMDGFGDLGDFIHDLAIAIGGALDAGVRGTLQTISTFMTGFVNAVTYIANALGQALTNLFTATGEFIADIGKAIVDGVNNFGTFLADMWDAITGNDGTPTAPYTAGAPTIKSSNIRTALRGQRAVAQSSIVSGSNLAPNPGFDESNFYLTPSSGSSYSTTLPKNGTQSLKVEALLGTYRGTNIISDDKQLVFVPCVAGEVYYIEGYVRGDSANGSSTAGYAYIQAEVKVKDPATSVISTVYTSVGSVAAGTAASAAWNKISGYVTMPANAFQFNVGCILHNTMTTGKIYYFDAITVREVTAAGQTWNTLWDSYSGTTGSTGKTPADVATKTSENYNSTTEYSRSGSNLIADPGFENITLDSLRAGCFNGSTWSYATAGVSGGVAHSGTRSLKCDWGGGQPYVLLTSSGRSGDKMPVRGGQTFYVSQWVFAPTANTGSNTVGMFLECTDSAGVSAVNYPGHTQVITENAWVKMEAYLRVPDTGYDRVRFYMCGVRTGAATGDDFYFDDVEVYEVTHSQNVVDKIYQGASGSTTSTGNTLDSVRVQIAGVNTTASQGVTDAGQAAGAASLAQQNIDVKAKDFTNLVAGSDFDAATQPWALATGFTMSTAQKNSGTQSMLISGTATANPTITYNLSKTFEAKPGEQFYMELWARKSSTYVGGDTTGPRFRMVRGNGVSAGTTIDQITLRASDITAADTWQKLSVTTVAVPSDTSSVYFALTGMPASAAGSLWVDDIVVRRVATADVVGALPQTKVNGLTTDLGYATDTANDASGTGVTNSSQIVALQAAQQSSSNSGNSGSDGFDYTTTTGLTPPSGTSAWNLTTVGTGTGTVRATGTSLAWVAGTSATATVRARFTKASTVTSYQRVSVVIDGPIFNALSSTVSPTPMVALVCRLDATWTSYVYARIVPTGSGNVQLTLWKVSGASEAQITTAGAGIYSWKLKIGDTIQLLAGDSTALTFRLYLNGNEVASINDSASIPSAGSFASVENADTNNFTGLMLRNGGVYSPAALASFAMTDSKPPTTVGSGIKVNRTATSTGALSSGENIFPLGWFGNIVDRTADLTYDTSGSNTGKVTVSVEGWYQCNFCCGTTGVSANGGVLYTILWTGSGSGARQVHAYGSQSRYNFAGGTGPVISGSFLIYLKAGDYVEPGYYSNVAFSGAIGSTDATFAAKTTWWSVALVNRSYS